MKPYRRAVEITFDEYLDEPADAIYVANDELNGRCSIFVTMYNGQNVVYRHIYSGTILPIKIHQVISSASTTATQVVALYRDE